MDIGSFLLSGLTSFKTAAWTGGLFAGPYLNPETG